MSHTHVISDGDANFIIDHITRAIKNKSGKRVVVQNDHKSEQLTFSIQKMVEGHDMSACDKVEVLCINKEKKDKSALKNKTAEFFKAYRVQDLRVDPNDAEKVIFSCTITDEVTQLVGDLNFSVRFYCSTDFIWNTAILSEIKVVQGMPKTNDQETSPEEILTEVEEILYENNIDGEDTVSKVANVVGSLIEIEKLIDESGVIEYDNSIES